MSRTWSKRQRDVFRLIEGDYPYNLVYGVPNSGKTSSTIGAFIAFSLRKQHGLFGVCAKTYKLLENNLIREVRAFCREMRLPFQARSSEYKDAFQIGSNHFVKLSGNDIAQVPDIQSYTLAGLYIDEVVNLTRDIFNELENRVRGWDKASVWMTANPNNPSHWFKRHYVDEAEARSMSVTKLHFADNPTVDERFIERMAASSGGLRRRRYLGEWAALTGRVYPKFLDPADAPPKDGATEWVVSIDPAQSGRTHALLLGKFGRAWWIVDEFVYHGSEELLTQTEQAGLIGDWVDRWQVSPSVYICDPASPNMARALMQRTETPAIGADHDVYDGICLTDSLLANETIRLSRGVDYLADELLSYSWDEKAAARGEDKPVKTADFHGVDALRYFCMTYGLASAS